MENKDFKRVAELLGREPVGDFKVVCRDTDGDPVVIETQPIIYKSIEPKPFPTIYWLVGKNISTEISRLEASGFIAEIEELLLKDETLLKSHQSDHEDYLTRRVKKLKELDLADDLKMQFNRILYQSGIGGLADFKRVRCLHMHYAFHLVRPTTVGKLIHGMLN